MVSVIVVTLQTLKSGVCFVSGNLLGNCRWMVLFSPNCTKILIILCSANIFFLPHLNPPPGFVLWRHIINHLHVISGVLRCYLSNTACRCGWDLTSIGFLMTVLFVWWVSPRKANVWQEIAVEEDWASCWAGLLTAVLYSLSLSPTLSSCLSHSIP